MTHEVKTYFMHLKIKKSKLLILRYMVAAEAAKRTVKKPRDSTSLNHDHGNVCFLFDLITPIIKGIN